jgi:hypothetical protein
MTKKDFFRLLIKIFTLYSVIISSFTLFPQIVLLNQMLDNVLLSFVVLGSILIVVLFTFNSLLYFNYYARAAFTCRTEINQQYEH